MPPIKKKPWSDVQTKPGILITGGYLKRAFPMDTKFVEDIDEYHQPMKYTFVRVNKGQNWLCKSVAGADASRRDLFSLTLFDDIEKAARLAATSSSDDSQPSQEATPVRRTYRSRRARDSITRITMPKNPPNCDLPTDTVEVRVFQDGRTGKAQWVDLESIPWLITYLRNEREYVGCVPNDTAVADNPIPGVSITWDWESEVWTATLSDTVRSTVKSLPQTITTSPHELTQAKWQQSAHRHTMTVGFDASTASQRREAARWFLIEFITTKLNENE